MKYPLSTAIFVTMVVTFGVLTACSSCSKADTQIKKSSEVTYIIYDTDREAAAKLYEKIYQDTLTASNSAFKSEEAEKAAQHAVLMVYGKPKQ